jgi:uncharacterized protein (DUF488 family)
MSDGGDGLGHSPRPRIYSIGHSTRDIEEFLSLLKRESVRRVADVRAFPTSRRFPHFNRDELARSLSAAGMEYAHHPDLGGRRVPRTDSRNTAWRNAGFRGYADYMETPRFRDALGQLVDGALESPTAMMCSEAVPWRCHRSLLADAFLALDWEVCHILDSGTSSHVLAPFARVERGTVRYSPADQPSLFAP